MLIPGSDTSAESHRGRDLPTELFEHILDELYINRYILALKNCSLVNHFFCSLSQQRLLRTVVIKLEPDISRNSPSLSSPPAVCAADEFLEVLRRAPHLSQHIHVLTIVSDMLYPVIRPNTDHWIASDPSLHLLLQNLTNLRSFRVKQGKKPPAGTELCTPFRTRSLQGIIFDVMPPTLVEIALELESVPFRYFQSCHWIKNLSVLSLDYNLPKTPSSPTPRLQRFELGRISPDFHAWLSFPGCPLDPGCIQILGLAPRTMYDMNFVQNLGPRMKSVCEIRIESSHFGHTAFAQYNTLNYLLANASLPIPNLQSFSALTTLSFSAAFFVRTFQRHTFIDYFTNPLVWIVNLVSSFPPNQLRNLILNFSFVSSLYGFPDEVVRLLRRDWAALRAILYEKQPSIKSTVFLRGLDHTTMKIVEDDFKSMDFAEYIIIM